MPLILWEDEFELGIKEIDEQHKKMLGIINKLYDIFESQKQEDQKVIDTIIHEMADYATYHFATEEKYLQLFGYEKIEEHVAIHNQYRTKIEDWHKRYDEGRDKLVFFEITNFLHDWWTWHINNTDRDYVSFLKANGMN
jgi:hemerythrin-like metal-binding protein